MSVVYSLYDALVSINVPDEKAKAVIDAMEREMMDKLATKADLSHSTELLSRDIRLVEERLSDRMITLDERLSNRMDVLGKKVADDFQAFESRLAIHLKSELGELKHAMTLRLGGMIAGTVLLVGALVTMVQAIH
jgi:hypothetical protein